jgi:prepilin-type N-terminal cleavage/methylation domain-containing protein
VDSRNRYFQRLLDGQQGHRVRRGEGLAATAAGPLLSVVQPSDTRRPGDGNERVNEINRRLSPRASRRARQDDGFSLIELLVVIAVLATLAAIVVFNVTDIRSRGSTAACLTDLRSVQTATAAYYNDHGQTYPTAGGTVPGSVILADLVPTYLHTSPTSTSVVSLDAYGTATAASC